MRRQLVVVTAAATTMVVVAFLVPLALLIRTLAAERAMTEARQAAQSLLPVLVGAPDNLDVAVAVAQTRLGEQTLGVYLPDGTTVGSAPTDDAVARARNGEAFTSRGDGGRVLYLPALVPDRGVAVMRATVPSEALTAGVRTSWLVLGLLGVTLIVGAVTLADRLGRAAVAPTRAVAEAARRLGERDLTARAPEAGPPEIVHIARAMNDLAVRMTRLLEAERERAADLSHRLRTPLTALRLDVEALDAGSSGTQLATDVDELERVIDQVIRDARRPDTHGGATTDVVAVARDRVAFWEPLAEDQSRSWDLHVETVRKSTTVGVDPAELAAAIDALLGNVIAHTPEGVGCTVRIVEDDASVRLVVEDDGPGMPAGAVLSRGVSGAGSTGLGLDIARRTARSAGGDLHIEPGESGARVVMVLPRLPS